MKSSRLANAMSNASRGCNSTVSMVTVSRRARACTRMERCTRRNMLFKPDGQPSFYNSRGFRGETILNLIQCRLSRLELLLQIGQGLGQMFSILAVLLSLVIVHESFACRYRRIHPQPGLPACRSAGVPPV